MELIQVAQYIHLSEIWKLTEDYCVISSLIISRFSILGMDSVNVRRGCFAHLATGVKIKPSIHGTCLDRFSISLVLALNFNVCPLGSETGMDEMDWRRVTFLS